MKKLINILFVAIFLLCSVNISNAQTKALELSITGFESKKGNIIVRVYNSEKGFPKSPKDAFKIVKKSVSADKCTIIISDLPPGDYAIVALHDENNNGKLDTNWVGFPEEKLGLSNYDKLGKPDFDKAKVNITGKEQKIEIALRSMF